MPMGRAWYVFALQLNVAKETALASSRLDLAGPYLDALAVLPVQGKDAARQSSLRSHKGQQAELDKLQ